MSLTTSILSRAAGHSVGTGDIAVLDVALVMAHDGSGPAAIRALVAQGIDCIAAAERTVFIFDHYFPPATAREAELQGIARDFANRHGIPVYAGRGISHQLLPELGKVYPGTVLIGGDSHTCTAGACGAFAMGVGATDLAAVMSTGRIWLQVPEELRIRLVGTRHASASGHDLALAVVAAVGISGALAKAVEFVGPAIEGLDMATRLKLANHTVEMGAVAGLFGIDERARRYLQARGADLSYLAVAPHDSDGRNAHIEVDLSRVRPLVARPSQPDNVVQLDNAERVRVDQVFIGSCAGGGLDDLRAAAKTVRGRRVHDGVRLLVGPASAEVLRDAAADGTMGTLVEAGATVLPVGCGACMGRLGTLGEGDVAVATQNRNFVGRAGHPRSSLYLASPASAAQAALDGYIGGRS